MSTQKLILTWYGHACFSLDNGRRTLVLDPYKSSMIGYPPLHVKAHAILASHDHEDHNDRAAVTLMTAPDGLVVPVPAGSPWPENADDSRFLVRTVETFHDEAGGTKRGRNRIHVIHTAGMTVAHLGDLGHLLSDEQAAAIGPVELLLLPVGGFFTIDADRALQTIRQLQPRNVAPMHYQIGYGDLPISTVDLFLEKIKPVYTVRHLDGPRLQLTPDEQAVCFVFQYQPS